MKTRSLITRATVTVLGIEMLCAAGLVSLAVWHEREVRLRGLDATLAGRSDSLMGAVQDAEDPLDNVKVDPDEFNLPADDEFAVFNPDGRVAGTSHGDISAVSLGPRDGIRNFRSGGHTFRVLQHKALRIIDREETGGVGLRRPVTVVYAVRSDHVWDEVLEATRFYILISLASLGLTAFLLIVFAQRLLQPLNELASAASSIEPGTLRFSPPSTALRTKELQPLAEALSETTSRLRHAFDSERRFISDAAHELKTAVAVARSSIQVLAMKMRSAEEYRDGLDRILEDNQRAEDLVAKMLTLARAEEADECTHAEVDFAKAIERTVNTLTPYAVSRQVSLRCTDASGDGRIRVSSEGLGTVVSNLVMNAVQHSQLGSSVLIDTTTSETQAILEVRDFGDGILAENLPHVFERFFREDPSRSRETGGAGLGLSICKSIVEHAGGTITIESEKGKGTRVIVRFEFSPRRERD